jgi:hypothetical protein
MMPKKTASLRHPHSKLARGFRTEKTTAGGKSLALC